MESRDVYEGVRSQIERGYLPLSVVLGDVHLKFRNPSLEDFDLAPEISPMYGWKQDVSLICSCLLAVNGRDVRYETHDLLKAFSCVSKSLKRILFSHLIRTTDRARRSFVYLEAFCYEDESRALWRTWKANRYMGFSPVGNQDKLSSLQSSWVTWNLAEDDRLAQREDWDRTLFSASAFNGSVQKIRSKWDSSDKEEEEHRAQVMKAAREGDLEKVKEGVSGQRQKTVKDLQEEMRQWVAGEEDEHDRIVREYKETVRNKVKEQAERARRMREESIARERELREHNVVARPIHAVSEDELKRIMRQRSDNTSIDPGVVDEYRAGVIDRFILTGEEAGNIALSEDKSALVQKKSESLMEQVSGRKPTL